ncbi:MAG TPA: hypothetical protein VHD33_03260, partial [Legionellaceae bacterium]|nr:hypothetical protein [Legionellaceae bacterium]
VVYWSQCHETRTDLVFVKTCVGFVYMNGEKGIVNNQHLVQGNCIDYLRFSLFIFVIHVFLYPDLRIAHA